MQKKAGDNPELEQALQQALTDKAVAQGKFEIAADVMHDIGNAMVGLGSYLARIKSVIDLDHFKNLPQLAQFFGEQQGAMNAALGEAKAGALVSLFNDMAETRRTTREELQTAVARQLSIIGHIQQILNIQRQYIAGHDKQESQPTNLRLLINDCISMLSASIEKRGIAVSLDVADGSPVITGDRVRLMQVIMNILKNSIEATERNPANKRISIRLDSGAGFPALEIADNGSGFDAATAGRLFERGFTTKSSGTGLGLHHCRAIVENHGGKISISSNGPGEGATTTIRFKI